MGGGTKKKGREGARESQKTRPTPKLLGRPLRQGQMGADASTMADELVYPNRSDTWPEIEGATHMLRTI